MKTFTTGQRAAFSSSKASKARRSLTTSRALPSIPSLPDFVPRAADGSIASHWGSGLVKETLANETAALGLTKDLANRLLADPSGTLADLASRASTLAERLSQAAASGVHSATDVAALRLQAETLIASLTGAASAAAGDASRAALRLSLDPSSILTLKDSLTGASGAESQGEAWGLVLGAAGILAVGVAALSAVRGAGGAMSDTDPLALIDEDPLLPKEYSWPKVEAYFANKPGVVAARALKVAAELGGVAAGVLSDMATGSVQRNEAKRAEQARLAIDRLGPAYVKVAQAVSTRVDVLSEAFLTEVQLLQDRVAPFPTPTALMLMGRDLPVPLEEAFDAISDKPVAAASLGQVYRARLSAKYGGGEVAIKVQRPGVLSSVALDLYLMRSAAVFLKEKFPDALSSDWAAILDNWAVRFFQEMNYVQEGENLTRFSRDMAQLEGIRAPRLYPELCSRRILTTEWVEGEKLSESYASDIRELCRTLLSAYLIQLLDTGFLHADPHPGNLIRTPDGKICVLDFGLMTEIDPDQRYALIEYIAHLSVGDWDGVAEDLYKLGFVPEGSPDLKEVGAVAIIGRILEQLVEGGGAKKLNIEAVTREIEELSGKYKFQVPPYFALILRSFSVIEGIALRVDPDYSIVKECFPYLSRRLLEDDSPRSREALRQLLYGRGKRIDLQRLRKLADGFSNFTTDGLKSSDAMAGRAPLFSLQDGALVSAASGTSNVRSSSMFATNASMATAVRAASPAPAASPPAAAAAASTAAMFDPAMRDAIRTIFRPQGSYFAEVLVEELAASVDALSREGFLELSRVVLASGGATVTLQTVEALGPLRPLLVPLPLPVELLARLAPQVKLSDEDRIALDNVRTIYEFLEPQLRRLVLQAQVNPSDFVQMVVRGSVSEGFPLAREVAPGLIRAANLFAALLARRASTRAAEDLERTGGSVASIFTQGPQVGLAAAAAAFVSGRRM